MIVKSNNNDPFATSTVIDDYALAIRDRYEGTLSCTHGSYNVRCRLGNDESPRVCAEVSIRDSIDDPDRAMAALGEFSLRALQDERWNPLSVDPRDGECIYSTTMTVDATPQAVDRFFADARDFLNENGEEIEQIIGGRQARKGGLDSIANFFGLAD